MVFGCATIDCNEYEEQYLSERCTEGDVALCYDDDMIDLYFDDTEGFRRHLRRVRKRSAWPAWAMTLEALHLAIIPASRVTIGQHSRAGAQQSPKHKWGIRWRTQEGRDLTPCRTAAGTRDGHRPCQPLHECLRTCRRKRLATF